MTQTKWAEIIEDCQVNQLALRDKTENYRIFIREAFQMIFWYNTEPFYQTLFVQLMNLAQG